MGIAISFSWMQTASPAGTLEPAAVAITLVCSSKMTRILSYIHIAIRAGQCGHARIIRRSPAIMSALGQFITPTKQFLFDSIHQCECAKLSLMPLEATLVVLAIAERPVPRHAGESCTNLV